LSRLVVGSKQRPQLLSGLFQFNGKKQLDDFCEYKINIISIFLEFISFQFV